MKREEFEAAIERVNRYSDLRCQIESLEKTHLHITNGRVEHIRVGVGDGSGFKWFDVLCGDVSAQVVRDIIEMIETRMSELAREMEAL